MDGTLMPLFMVKKEVFEWTRTGQKTIELRRGKAKQDNNAVFNVEGRSSEELLLRKRKVV
jgi:hypothetical protein